MKWLSYSVMVAWIGLAVPAAAAPPSAEAHENDASARARELFREGVMAFKAERYTEAKDLLEESLKLRKAYDTAGLLGQAELELGNYRSAAQHIEYCLRNFPTGGSQELFAEVQTAFESVKNYVGTVRLSGEGTGVELFLDGKPLGISPLGYDLFVDPGEHTIRTRTTDGAVTEETFHVNAGEEKLVKLNFGGEPEPASEPAAAGRALSTDSAESLVDEKWIPAYIVGSVSAAALVASVVFRISASSQATDVKRLQSEVPPGACVDGNMGSGCGSLRSALRGHDRAAVAANTTLAIGAVGAAATAGYVLYLLLDKPQTESGVRASAAFDGSSGGVFLTGSF